VINFTRRSWFAKEEFRLDGDVSTVDSKSGKLKPIIQIYGNWNNMVYLQTLGAKGKPSGEPELVWTKTQYPEKWDHMYGMSHFSL